MDTFQICGDCAGELGKKFLSVEDKNLKTQLCQMCWLNFGTFLERRKLLEEQELNDKALEEFRFGEDKKDNIKGGILKSIKNFFEKIYFDFLSKLSKSIF